MLLGGVSENMERETVLESFIPEGLLTMMFKSCAGIFCFHFLSLKHENVS